MWSLRLWQLPPVLSSVFSGTFDFFRFLFKDSKIKNSKIGASITFLTKLKWKPVMKRYPAPINVLWWYNIIIILNYSIIIYLLNIVWSHFLSAPKPLPPRGKWTNCLDVSWSVVKDLETACRSSMWQETERRRLRESFCGTWSSWNCFFRYTNQWYQISFEHKPEMEDQHDQQVSFTLWF